MNPSLRLLRLILAVPVLCLLSACDTTASSKPIREGPLQSGDVVFQDSGPASIQAGSIKALTKSHWSHCGIFFETAVGGFVVDGNGSPGPATWSTWQAHGAGGRYAALRLKSGLTAAQVASLRQAAGKLDSRPYDVRFAWDDPKIYCSELVWKAYQNGLGIQLCRPGVLGDFDLHSPAAQPLITRKGGWGTVAKAEAHRNEPVVSPQQLVESSLLMQVH